MLAKQLADKDNGCMEKLKNLYVQGNFEGARKLLMERKENFPEGLFHYNLGTLYAREGNLALGRYHLEKALSENFANRMLFNNLETVKTKLDVLDLGRSESLAGKMVDGSLSLPPGIWLTLSLLLCLGLIFAVKGKMIRGFAWLTVSCILVAAPLVYSRVYLGKMRYAVVLEDAKIYEGPSQIYSSTGVVEGGSKIIVGRSNNKQHFIVYPKMFSGWVHRDSLGFL